MTSKSLVLCLHDMLAALKKHLGHRSSIRLTYHRLKAFAAALSCGFPARKLRIIAITGTDGKTTTVGMTAHILHESGIAVAALSTAFFRIKESVEWNATEKTSPNPFVIQRFLRRAVREGCEVAVMEVSSHGLVQGRVNHTRPEVAAMTNISQEHLDYHGTMQRYIADKGLLFRKHLRKEGTAVFNADDESYGVYRSYDLRNVRTYGSDSSNSPSLVISNVKSDSSSMTCDLHDNASGRNTELRLNVPGIFNAHNAACAILCAEAIGLKVGDAAKALESFRNAPGRMERIDEGQNFDVFIDFTVTPNAFDKTLETLNEIKGERGRTLILTGSCGDRMKEKRPIIGRMCSERADVVVITDDEPYTEDPLQIIEQVWQGVNTEQCEAHKIFDRREAIEKILSLAREGDCVLLCGMGSYPSRWTKDGPVEWNEQEIARDILRSMS